MLALRNEQPRLGELVEHFEELVARRRARCPAGAPRSRGRSCRRAGSTPRAPSSTTLRRDGFAVFPQDANFIPSLAIVAHVAGELGDAELAAEVEPLLRPYTDYWVVLGPGPATLGPVAYSVGLLNLLRGRLDHAARYFAVAIEKSELMRARPYVRALAGRAGRGAAPARRPAATPSAPRSSRRRRSRPRASSAWTRLLREAEAVARS